MPEDLRYWVSDFKGKYRTSFVSEKVNEDIIENYVVAKSMVVGMGLTWGAQYLKIKNLLGCCFREITISKGLKTKVCLLNKKHIPGYIDNIQLSRVSDSAKERVGEYRESFFDFVNGETTDDDLTIFDAYMENGIDGIKKLVRDTATMNYLSGYDQIADILHELMSNKYLTLDELIISNKVHDIADYLSKNQFKLRQS